MATYISKSLDSAFGKSWQVYVADTQFCCLDFEYATQKRTLRRVNFGDYKLCYNIYQVKGC